MRRCLLAALWLWPGLVHAESPEAAAAQSAVQTPRPAVAPKFVPAILINKDQVVVEQPHLPDPVKAGYAGRVVMGAYKVCISENGTVDSVKPVSGIAGPDERIIETVKLWRYKPQPAPVCFIQSFEFTSMPRPLRPERTQQWARGWPMPPSH